MKKNKFFIVFFVFILVNLSYGRNWYDGYLIFVSLETYEISNFGAISTEEEANKIFENIKIIEKRQE